MAFQQGHHLHHEIAFQRFTEEQELSENNREMQQQQQQNFLHLQQPERREKSMEGNRSESSRYNNNLREYKADILGHPLYDQLLSAHVSCLRIATPVDQLPRIDAQLQQSPRVVEKYSPLGNGVLDHKDLDHFMVCFSLL